MASMWGEIIKYPLMIKYKQNELAVISQFDENMSVKSMVSHVANIEDIHMMIVMC